MRAWQHVTTHLTGGATTPRLGTSAIQMITGTSRYRQPFRCLFHCSFHCCLFYCCVHCLSWHFTALAALSTVSDGHGPTPLAFPPPLHHHPVPPPPASAVVKVEPMVSIDSAIAQVGPFVDMCECATPFIPLPFAAVPRCGSRDWFLPFHSLMKLLRDGRQRDRADQLGWAGPFLPPDRRRRLRIQRLLSTWDRPGGGALAGLALTPTPR